MDLIAEAQPILEHLLVALAAGGAIGLERSYHGRPPAFARMRWCVWRRAF